MDYTKLTLDELKQHKIWLDEAIEDKQAEAIQSARKQVEQLALSLGVSPSSLLANVSSGTMEKTRKPAKPKYINPVDATQTWTGRGIKPRWVQTYIDNGGKIEKLLISAQA